jgi:hypothetical protein
MMMMMKMRRRGRVRSGIRRRTTTPELLTWP